MESLDDVFGLFTRERRRFALYYLEDRDGPVPVAELATRIEEWETGSPPSEPPDEAYRDVVLTLKHQHLPKAAQAEYVEYDPDRSVVELKGSPPAFRVVLSVAEAIEQPRGDDITRLR